MQIPDISLLKHSSMLPNKVHLVFVFFSICLLRTARIISEQKKKTNVTPVHIKDSMEQTENYRPISLLRIISKVLERWVSIKLYNHGKQFISPLQHGFLRNRFCTTQLLSVNAISRNLDKNIQTEVIYLDLAKAFDSVDH